MTKNMVVGESVYGEKRIAVEEDATKLEYRVWNPFRSKLAAAVLGGVDNIHMPPGSKVMFLPPPLSRTDCKVLCYRCSTWELLAAPLSVMCQTLLDLKVIFYSILFMINIQLN